MKNSFYIDLQRFMLIPTKFPLTQLETCTRQTILVRVYKKSLPNNFWEALAVRTGLEPVTPCVTGMYSNQLN